MKDIIQLHQMNGGGFVVANTDDEAKIDRIMKVLDAYGNQDLWMKFYNGVEGMHSEVVTGNPFVCRMIHPRSRIWY